MTYSPQLPNELLMHIIEYIPSTHLSVFLLVSRYTHQLVSGKAYRKTIFPDTLPLSDIMNFCQRHGSSLVTVKLPHGKRYSDTFYMLLFQLCPQLNFLQSSMTPKQLVRFLFRTRYPLTCFMMTQHTPSSSFSSCQQQQQHQQQYYRQQQHQQYLQYGGDELDELMQVTQDLYNVTKLTCCSSIFLFPNHPIPDSTLTHISHYFHHPGALRNAILPTFGPDLLSLTLNMYDVLTVSVAQMIAVKCPQLRYLHIPQIKAEGLWLLLHKCNTLVAIVVGGVGGGGRHRSDDDIRTMDAGGNGDHNNMVVMMGGDDRMMEGDDLDRHADHVIEEDDGLPTGNIQWINHENKKAVATVESHKRVWCIHQQQQPQQHSSHSRRLSWHIGILPKR
ncbi:hypothetical protein BCR42DRAFT_414090 [Absidia repens]|uniref:F-box domain-containing protein n=1 Tax=Absidia repens TaxID=90262 RepID=A0A1X2IIN9_9FUNG|nr:hypothetical protein BCR42DRAFT_414090 [Absidia repens]